MTETRNSLLAEAERREAALMAKLAKIGRDDLATEYRDIITLRNAADVMGKPVTRFATRARVVDANASPPPEGFVLSVAVRNAVREMTKPRFRATDVFGILQRQFPTYITTDKKPSISA